MKKLHHSQTLKVEGRSRLCAWKLGVIPALLSTNGGNLPEAIKQAKESGALVHSDEVHNLVVNTGKAMICDLILDIESTGITYHAIGTDNVTPVVGDTVLGTETNRKLWTAKTRTSAVITFSEFYLASESTFYIHECGVFGGASANATPDSGVLFSHYLQHYDNSAGLVDLTFEYELEVS